MDYFLLFGIAGFACLILGFIGYKRSTDKIIKEQDRELAALETENKRLKSALRGLKRIQKVYFSDKEIDYPPTDKITLTARDDVKEY